jgi:hypothetical protein
MQQGSVPYQAWNNDGAAPLRIEHEDEDEDEHDFLLAAAGQ